MLAPRSFRFLNEPGSLEEVGWDGNARSKLWYYNLHYFDDLNAEGAPERHEWHLALIRDWIADNPPGQGTAWEPYPVSLRIVNWIKWMLAGNQPPPEAIASLAIQTRWLCKRLEWHLLGNHLFVNAKALVFAGLFFRGDEARKWLDKGFRILRQQVEEQILPDGGQFELSPMYHALALEDMLDLLNAANCYRDALNAQQLVQVEDWRQRVPAMSRWLGAVCHPDGSLAFFNDTALGVSANRAELLAYCRRMGITVREKSEPLTMLADSGYARLEKGSATIVADVARIGPDYLPGHGHADTLSFELSLGQRRIVVNSGISEYGTGPERQRQRGTAAHSTLELDGMDSSEVWGGFRVARRAYPLDVAGTAEDTLILQGAHNGYSHLAGHPIHFRRWTLDESELCILDEVQGSGMHHASIVFHLGPDLGIMSLGENRFRLVEKSSGEDVAFVQCAPHAQASVAESSWHPGFGLSHKTWQLKAELAGSLPLRHETRFWWSA